MTALLKIIRNCAFLSLSIVLGFRKEKGLLNGCNSKRNVYGCSDLKILIHFVVSVFSFLDWITNDY